MKRFRQLIVRCRKEASMAHHFAAVSNLGAFGIESFTPLLNVPQVAILGVDAIFPRAVINPDGSVGAEQRIGFSLTADHQVIDGADAARFLRDLCSAIADIDLTVLG
jgi:pyruvate dehydrogenase E2 component (dihydrolipoamide acetyltransferase)